MFSVPVVLSRGNNVAFLLLTSSLSSHRLLILSSNSALGPPLLGSCLNSNCLFFFLRLMKGRVDLQKPLPHLHQPTRPLWPGFVLWRFCRPLRGSTNDGATMASRSLPRRHLALILTAISVSEMPSGKRKRKAFSFYFSDF